MTEEQIQEEVKQEEKVEDGHSCCNSSEECGQEAKNPNTGIGLKYSSSDHMVHMGVFIGADAVNISLSIEEAKAIVESLNKCIEEGLKEQVQEQVNEAQEQ